ncbi:DUF262 domain-containing HNH endonuclease family protein [Caulobacter sp. Root342]|uniref:DUF262 domain-containing protein n=1 Tax=Caulobacter sp. Root342 TaxID=1736519 RepID=UPI00070037CE|nr:DUF262 domain-containing HNH endonuclease family protein [Caulobacter sp. Root342]KQV54667.1 hypothetical protein ASC62_23030 [Caulobacter sp. Root342]
MTIQIDQIFKAQAENLWQFLNTPGQGCYIPAYQRTYAWDAKNVDRLVDDAVNGLNHLMTRPAAISFLGTIIAIHDTNLVTVQPVYQSEVAPRVMTLIDGQQRISTAVMMNVAMHAHLTALVKRIEKQTGEAFDWIREQTAQILAELRTTFVLDQNTGQPEVYRYYPRIIRAYDDVWSKKGSQAFYKSPVARLIWTYINHLQATPKDAFKYVLKDDEGLTEAGHESVAEVFAYIRKKLDTFTNRKPSDVDFPDIQQAVQTESFMKALWGYAPPPTVVAFITQESGDAQFPIYAALLRSLVFHKYFNTRMALTVVTTRSEDDAFDMFEALNTTGEPLTAFETFKPKVIEAEGLGEYKGSPSYTQVQRIEEYLNGFDKARDRQNATLELFIPFALAWSGDKLPKNLSDQRRYLRDRFEKLDLEQRRNIVTSLANLTAFMRTGWLSTSEDPELEAFGKFDEETGFCFEALRALKHNVTVGALSRFYDEFRRADDTQLEQRRQDFAAAVRATTAFSMLWRGAYRTTENIDGIYRSVMLTGQPADAILPLAKHPKEGLLGAVSLSGYKRMLWTRLTAAFPTRDAWVKSASQNPVFEASRDVAKFLLLAASDDAANDPSAPGLVIRGVKGLAPTVQTRAWGADAHVSAEHIAPQNPKTGSWSEAIYDDPRTVHRLGNLILLPVAENSMLSNKPWNHKQLIYQYLCAETDSEADTLYQSFGAQGLTVGKRANAVLGEASYMRMCKSIASTSGDWSLDIVERRSVRIAELAYDRMVAWLAP